MSRHASILGLTAVLALGAACSDDAIDAGAGGSSTSGAGGSPSSTGAGASGSTQNVGGNGSGGAGGSAGPGGGVAPPTELAECQGHVYECGDLVDNDGDGLLDSVDPDCLGPCDDTEDSYYGGIPGQSGPACKVDCYFDQDSGPGNDDCHWTHACDPLSVDPAFHPEPWEGDRCEYQGGDAVQPPTGNTCDELFAEQSEACTDFCKPLTPNGCDCFGCCELPAGSGSWVWLGSEGVDPDAPTVCTAAAIDDPDVCHPCTPVAGCLNDCAPCEVCIGKPAPGPDCGEGGGSGSTSSTGGTGGGTQCAEGVTACGLPGQEPCGGAYACITGCCIPVPN